MKAVEQVGRFLGEHWSLVATCVLGALGVYCLVPRQRRIPLYVGLACSGLALLLTGFFLVRVVGATVEGFLFYVFSLIAVVAGGLLVTQHNPARAALSFALVILATCGLFLLQGAPFLAAATVVVYAGAIIVTFLFVLMLAQQEGFSTADARSREPFLGTLLGFLLLGTLLFSLKRHFPVETSERLNAQVNALGQVLDEIARLNSEGALSSWEKKLAARDQIKAVMESARSVTEKLDADLNPDKEKPVAPAYAEIKKHLVNAQGAIGRQEPNLRDLLAGEKPAEPNNPDFILTFDEIAANLQALRGATQDALRRNEAWARRPRSTALSQFSGPRPSHRPEDFRRDEHGRPHLPAENTAYLGRSLFSDYLLAVELAGLLLLVATIGAIAIAQRREARKNPADAASENHA